MKNTYGFTLKNKDRYGLKRWFNGETQLITNNPLGRLPGILHSINIAQNVLDFDSSFNYCRGASKEYSLDFTELTEKDWNAIQHPVKRFFKKILQWNKLKQILIKISCHYYRAENKKKCSHSLMNCMKILGN